MVHASHTCDSLDRPPALHLNVVKLDTVTPTPADVGLNPNNKD
jgi:hypothetical protein